MPTITRSASVIAALCTAARLAAFAADPPEQDIAALHVRAGRSMDQRYYDAGRRVDLALFDLDERARQGKPVPAALARQARRADREMRERWAVLDGRREELARVMRALPPPHSHRIRIEDLEAAAGDAGWFGLRGARVTWESGATVALSPRAFQGAAQIASYAYRVEPAAAAFIYGRGSGQDAMTAGFERPADAKGAATLTLDGLDDDKPGVTRIRIYVNDTIIFEGPNPFPPDSWAEQGWPVPDLVWAAGGADARRVDALRARFEALQRDIEAFGAWADRRADAIEASVAPWRAGLTWRPLALPADWWETDFLRGVCYAPFAQDLEHHFKSFRHLNATLLYSYAGLYNSPTELPVTLAWADTLGLPYVQFTFDMRNEERDRLYLGDSAAMMAAARDFLRRVEGDSGVPVHLAVDEPNFRDAYAADPAVLAAFRAYLNERRPTLEAAGIAMPRDQVPVTRLEREEDRAAWMEWQMFKTVHMGRNYARLWDDLRARDRFPFVIVQDHRADHPQQASHVAMGAALPLISTDLYSNGTVREALVMDLVRHAAKGRAVLTAGAGYSDHTPDRFRRSLAVAMAHADGVLQWTDIYFSKFRDPVAFWKTTTDDQGRSMLANWRPEYWAIMEEEYGRMERAGRALGGGESRARIAVLFSERTAIADSAGSGEPYVAALQGLYSDLLRRGRPVDAVYVENLTPKVASRYRVLLLPNAHTLTPPEAGLLRAWVRSGGTLIASGAPSLRDEWSRPMPDFALAEVFGARYAGEGTGGAEYIVGGAKVPHEARAGYARVRPLPGAIVAARFDTGDPAVVSNAYGRGMSWLFTGHGHFARAGGRRVDSGLFGQGHPAERDLVVRLVDGAAGDDVVRLENAPDGLELAVREKDGVLVIHLTDWMDGRELKGLRLGVKAPGRWKARYPAAANPGVPWNAERGITVRPFRIHEVIVLEPAD